MSTTPTPIRRTAKDLFADPEFQKLGANDQRAILLQSDPDFAALSANDQTGIILRLQKSQPFEESPIGRAGRSLGEFAEDVLFPGVGAVAGGTLGASLGPPGIAGGAGIGAVAGLGAKKLVRTLQGRQAPQTLLQDVVEAVTTAAGGPLQESTAISKATQAGRALSATKPLNIPPQLQAAQDLGVPLRKGQAFGGIRSTGEQFLSRTLGGATTFRKQGLQQAAALESGVDQFLTQISRSKLSREDAGIAIQDLLSAARARAGSQVGDALDAIATELPGLQVSQKGPLSTAAKELLNDVSGPTAQFPSLRKMAGEDINQAISVLQEFTGESKQIPIRDAVKLRSLIFKMTNSDDISTVGVASLKRLNSALNTAIQDTVRGAGRADLADAFANASTNFRTVVDSIESKAISRLVKEDKPELVIDILLSKGSATRTQRLIELTGKENFKPIARAAVEKVFDESTNEGVLISQSFAKIRKRIGNDTLNTLLGPENVASFERISKLIDSLGLTNELTQPKPAFGGLGLLQGGLAGAGVGVATANPEKAALGLGFAAGVIGIPALLAKAATRPGGLATLEKSLNEASRAGGRKEVFQRLVGLAGAEASRTQLLKKLEPQEDANAPVVGRNRSLLNR